MSTAPIPQNLIDVFDPEGNKGKLPAENMQEAAKRGFRVAVRVTSPEGEGGWVPNDKAHEALIRGFKLGPPEQQPQSLLGKIGAGMNRGMDAFLDTPAAVYHAITDAPKNPEEEQSAALSGRGGLAMRRIIADPMTAQREKAKQTQGIESLGHSAAGLLPFIGPFAGQSGEAIGKDPASGLAELGTNVAIPKFLAGALSRGTPKIPVAQHAAERLYQSGLKPSLAANTSEGIKSIVRTGLENKIPVSEVGQAKLSGLIDNLNKSISGEIASNPGAPINKFKVASRLTDTANEFANQVNPTKDLGEIAKSGNEFLDTQPGNIPASQAQNLKVGTYKQLKGKYGELNNATVEAQKALARGLKEELETKFPEIKNLNAEESRLIGLDTELERAVKRIGNREMLGGPTFILKHILDTPAMKSRLAIALSQASRGSVPMFAANARIVNYATALNQAVGATNGPNSK